MLLYLTSEATGCQGGETVFYPDDIPGKNSLIKEEIAVSLETGMLLLHKHGNDCMLVSYFNQLVYLQCPRYHYNFDTDTYSQHEGREVTDGEKWVIRSDLCVRRGKSRFAD